jgi:zinc protease
MGRVLIHALLATAWVVPAAKASTKSVLPAERRATALPNGLRIFMVKYPSPGVVAYQIPVRVGSRNEVEAGKSGFAHFFEHLMFRGTKNRTGAELSALYTKLGVENNAWTDLDLTNYHGVTATANLPQVLEAEADRFRYLQFSEALFKDEAGAVLGEYFKNVSNPGFVLEEKLAATAFRKHPYGHTTMGYKEDIAAYPTRFADVWPFFHRYYRPDNVSIVLVGDVGFERERALVEKYFGDWKAKPTEPVSIPEEPKQTEPRRADVKLEVPTQMRIAVAYKVPAFTTAKKDAAALTIAAELAFSVVSEFQSTYKFQRGWVDEVKAAPSMNLDPGLWTIWVRLTEAGEQNAEAVLAAVENTVAQLRKAPPSNLRLLNAKKRVRNAALLGAFHSPEALASQVAWYTSFEPDLDVLDRVLQRVAEVQPADVLQFAKAYLIDTGKTVVVLRGKK